MVEEYISNLVHHIVLSFASSYYRYSLTQYPSLSRGSPNQLPYNYESLSEVNDRSDLYGKLSILEQCLDEYYEAKLLNSTSLVR